MILHLKIITGLFFTHRGTVFFILNVYSTAKNSHRQLQAAHMGGKMQWGDEIKHSMSNSAGAQLKQTTTWYQWTNKS